MPKRKPKVTPPARGVRTAAGCHDPPGPGGVRIEGVKHTFFFQTLSKANIFLLSGETQNFFSPFISFDSPYTMLSSRGVTTFPWTFHHVF